jgi:hypothetical protein
VGILYGIRPVHVFDNTAFPSEIRSSRVDPPLDIKFSMTCWDGVVSAWVHGIAGGTRRPTWLGMNARYCYQSMVAHLSPMLVVVSLFAEFDERRVGESPSLQSANGHAQIPYFFIKNVQRLTDSKLFYEHWRWFKSIKV